MCICAGGVLCICADRDVSAWWEKVHTQKIMCVCVFMLRIACLEHCVCIGLCMCRTKIMKKCVCVCMCEVIHLNMREQRVEVWLSRLDISDAIYSSLF